MVVGGGVVLVWSSAMKLRLSGRLDMAPDHHSSKSGRGIISVCGASRLDPTKLMGALALFGLCPVGCK